MYHTTELVQDYYLPVIDVLLQSQYNYNHWTVVKHIYICTLVIMYVINNIM